MNFKAYFITFLFLPFVSFSQGNVIKNRVTFDGDPGKYFLTMDLKIKKWNPITDELERVGELGPCTCPDYQAKVSMGAKGYYLQGTIIYTPENKQVGSFSPYNNEPGIVPMGDGWGKEKEKPAEEVKPVTPTPKRRTMDWEN